MEVRVASCRSIVLGLVGSAMIAGSAVAAGDGPEVTLDITKVASWDSLGPEFRSRLDFDVGVEWPSGWGVDIEGGAGALFAPSIADGLGHLRVYRSVGDFEIGLGGVAGFICDFNPINCSGGFGLNVSLFYEYESDRLTISSENYAWFYPTIDFDTLTDVAFRATDRLIFELAVETEGLANWHVGLTTTYSVTERLDVWNSFARDFGARALGFGASIALTDAMRLWAEIMFINAGFQRTALGADYDVSDWLDLRIGYERGTTTWSTWMSAEIDDRIGTGPFSLVGGAEARYTAPFGGWRFNANIGINYAVGDE